MSTPPNDPQQNPQQPPEGGGYGAAPPPGDGGYYAAPRYEPGPDTRPVVSKPKPLDTAVKLMYVGAALSLVSLAISFFQTDAIREETREQLETQGQEVTQELLDGAVTIGIVVSVLIGLIGTALWVLMAVMNGKGKKWARTTATVLGALGIVFNLFALTGGSTGASTALNLVLSVLTILLAAAILVLLWNKENNPYYEAMSGPPRG